MASLLLLQMKAFKGPMTSGANEPAKWSDDLEEVAKTGLIPMSIASKILR